MSFRRGPQAAVLAAAGATVLLWSGTPIANKVAVATIDPATAGILRSLLAGVLGGGLALALKLPFPRDARQRVLLVLSGLGNFALWPLFLSLGLGLTTANHAGFIIATIPIVTGLMAAALERAWPRRRWWIGGAVALLGTAFLIFHREGAPEAREASMIGDLLILTGVLACAFGYVAGGKLAPAIGTWAATFWGLGTTAVVLLPVVALLAGRTEWSAVDAAGWLAIAYMTVLASFVGYIAWFWALGHGGIARMSAWQLAQPVVTTAMAALLLGESLSWPLVASGAVILVGATLAQWPASPRAG
ncbi:MAG TPA: DMT family transporter [Gammaproteobacteria bacterium]